MVSNIYLNELLNPLCQSYGGCFSSDNIPSIAPKEQINFIVNLSKEVETGSHFIALIIKERHVFYFDSFGNKCTNASILKYMSNLSREIVYNSVKIQDNTSKFCGFYCALIVLRNDKRCQMNTDLLFHSSSLHLNDPLCIEYICETVEKMQQKEV
jgi:hypothetical protein